MILDEAQPPRVSFRSFAVWPMNVGVPVKSRPSSSSSVRCSPIKLSHPLPEQNGCISGNRRKNGTPQFGFARRPLFSAHHPPRKNLSALRIHDGHQSNRLSCTASIRHNPSTQGTVHLRVSESRCLPDEKETIVFRLLERRRRRDGQALWLG